MVDEKFDEKSKEKTEEKTQEKSPEEKYRRDPLGTIIWALILIWAGVVLLMDNLGYLSKWLSNLVASTGWSFLGKLEAWQFIVLGAGIFILIEIVLRLIVPDFRQSITGSLILAVILIGLGLGGAISWSIIWPILLIILGLSVILRGVWRKQP